MKLLIVDIIKYSADFFPGYVICSFTDTFGKVWYIEEKVPVVSSENITENTELPMKGYIAGEIIHQNENIVCFCTETPWDIMSQCGENKFCIHENQLIEKD